MPINCGIIGLPNVGKSTIFQALTSAPAEAANYPFCTIEPNVGIVAVRDPRLEKIAQLIPADKEVPTLIEFVDIAGLVKGASQGEGLGNQFLSNIREVGLLVHVVRCFENDDIIHVSGEIDPIADIQTIRIELALADLVIVENRKEKNLRNMKQSDTKKRKEAEELDRLLSLLIPHLEEGKTALSLPFSDAEKLLLRDLNLITFKKEIYLCNIGEEEDEKTNQYVEQVRTMAQERGSEVITLCGQLEAEITKLETLEERQLFLSEMGLEESGLDRMIRLAYQTLGLRTFFTVGDTENKAWTFREGMSAPQCAGLIHTDFERGFIKAEIYSCDDLFTHQGEKQVRESGKLRTEGKEYKMQDGDIVHFRFNV